MGKLYTLKARSARRPLVFLPAPVAAPSLALTGVASAQTTTPIAGSRLPVTYTIRPKPFDLPDGYIAFTSEDRTGTPALYGGISKDREVST